MPRGLVCLFIYLFKLSIAFGKKKKKKIILFSVFFSKEIKEAWDFDKTLKQNLSEMGLVYDTNETFKIPTTQQVMKPKGESTNTESDMEVERPKLAVVQALEEEANAPRERKFRLPQSQVDQVTCLMDKYGEDYKAMAQDPKNYYQETWKQIRAKIKKFKSIPEQYEEYLNKTKS